MNLEDLKNKINKNVKGVHADILSKSEIANIKEWVPTPHYDLNRILSGSLFKGLPEKTVTLLVGPEASFKSSFICLSMANAQQLGYTPVIFDTEGAWKTDFAERWGLDCNNALFLYTPFVEDVLTSLGQLIGDEKKFIIGLDSIGNLEVEKLEQDITKSRNGDGNTGDGRAKADQGQLQKKIKRMSKVILSICKRQNSIALLAGHYYGSPTQYGSAEEIGGGKHIKLAPRIILSFKKSKLVENKKVIGNRITAITLKNDFYPAFQETTIDIDYRRGIDPYSNLEKLAEDANLITQSGSWYTNNVTGEKVQGASNISKIIDIEILQELDKHLQKTGYSSINREMEGVMKEADEIIEEADTDVRTEVKEKY